MENRIDAKDRCAKLLTVIGKRLGTGLDPDDQDKVVTALADIGGAWLELPDDCIRVAAEEIGLEKPVEDVVIWPQAKPAMTLGLVALTMAVSRGRQDRQEQTKLVQEAYALCCRAILLMERSSQQA